MNESEIRKWFSQSSGCGLKLPNGWFGQPYGDIRKLSFVAMTPRRLIIELSKHLLLVFLDVESVETLPDRIRIIGFKQLVFSWFEFGGSEDTHLTEYTEGCVEFIDLAKAMLRSSNQVE